MQNVTNPTVKTHVVWLDVVRLIAMFTVVCCHCTDPFNFYPGDSPIIGDIKFWGAAYGAFLRPCVLCSLWLREPCCYRSGKRLLFSIRKGYCVYSGLSWFGLLFIIYFLGLRDCLVWGRNLFLISSLFGRRGDSSIVERIFRLYRPDTVQFLIVGCTYVVYLFIDWLISLFADLLRLGGESVGKGEAMVFGWLGCYPVHLITG